MSLKGFHNFFKFYVRISISEGAPIYTNLELVRGHVYEIQLLKIFEPRTGMGPFCNKQIRVFIIKGQYMGLRTNNFISPAFYSGYLCLHYFFCKEKTSARKRKDCTESVVFG